jgi:putative transposase
VSLLHAHPVFVTKHRHRVLTDAMLTFTEHTKRGVCADLNTELVEFTGEPDHMHLLVAYPPTLAISVLTQRLKSRAAYEVRREFTGACVRARIRGHLWSPSYFAVSCRGAPLSIIKQYIDGQTRPL